MTRQEFLGDVKAKIKSNKASMIFIKACCFRQVVANERTLVSEVDGDFRASNFSSL
ncbi:MAG: hypothetical protein GY774_15970 [Planctomycetes bacterium]|nr:hypothetical protein [Planctomycetota bacterium]